VALLGYLDHRSTWNVVPETGFRTLFEMALCGCRGNGVQLLHVLGLICLLEDPKLRSGSAPLDHLTDPNAQYLFSTRSDGVSQGTLIVCAIPLDCDVISLLDRMLNV